MREIKFRAWDKDNKEMNYGPKDFGGVTLHPNIGWHSCAVCGYHIGTSGSRFELMQYTGLKDKNGKEIYEGDILSETRSTEYMKHLIKDAPNPMLYVCKWVNMGFTLQSLKPCPFNESKFFYHIENDCEVIGNIYENKELSEAKK